MNQPLPPGQRYAMLDGVRGLAALMVAFSHYTLALQPALLGGGPDVAHFAASVALSHTALVVLFNPELGVAIFFVLSGFVLAASVASRPTPFIELLARRWVRLAIPVLGTSSLIWVLVAFHAFWSVEAGPLAKSTWLAGQYVWVGFMANDPLAMVWQSVFDIFVRGRHMYNTALWTMPTEFYGSIGLFAAYCGLPFVFARRGGGILLACIAAALLWKTAYFGFPFGILLFELRRLLVALPEGRRARLAAIAPPAGFALLIAGVLMGGNPYNIDLPAHGPYARLFLTLGPWIENPVLLMHRVGAVSLVAAALLWRPMQAFLLGRVCQWLGRVSFMVYLCHLPLLCSPIAWGLLRLEPLVGYNAATALLLPVFVVVLFAIAELATRAFDLPAIGLSRRAGLAVSNAWRTSLTRLRPSRA